MAVDDDIGAAGFCILTAADEVTAISFEAPYAAAVAVLWIPAFSLLGAADTGRYILQTSEQSGGFCQFDGETENEMQHKNHR